MILRMTALAGLALGILGQMRAATIALPRTDTKPKGRRFANARKALQEVQDFIGLWNLEGTRKLSGKTKPGRRRSAGVGSSRTAMPG